MALKLRQTKLLPPPLRPILVQRPRLIAHLNQAVDSACRAVVVTAPAGFGKTTQVRQWLSSGEQRDLRSEHAKHTAWLTLDEGDNDPDRFLRYLVAAMQRVAPPAVEAAQALLALPQVDIEELITTLANDLAASPDPVTLVLDDYHQIHAQAIHEALCRLVEALPPSAQLVVVSREDPPLPLARLRARGELVELRLVDLRFTDEETTTFLNACMGLDLPPAQIATLAARTEGWVAGLQLAALSLQTTDDRTAFVAAFSGTQRYILDYLVEDVLSRQPEEVQDFLLRSAILERFCAPLCDAILEAAPDAPGTAGRSVAMLAYLEHANLFLIPLDDNRMCYRYHQLFADLLRTRLAASHAGLIPDLHRRAARWLETHGEPQAAFNHAVAARDYGYAAEIVDRAITARWRETDMDFFQTLGQLPGEALIIRPALALYAAWADVMANRVDRVPELVEAAERHLLTSEQAGAQAFTPADHGLRAFARVLRAYLDDFNDRSPLLDAQFDGAIDTVPVDNVGMRNSIAVVLGSIRYAEGDFASAAHWFENAVKRDVAANGTNAIPVAVARWARMCIVQGRLHQAAGLCREYIAYVRERGSRRFNLAGSLNLVWGEVLREWNKIAEAETQIRSGLELNERWPVPQARLSGLTVLARLQIAQGDWAGADESLEHGQQIITVAQIHPDYRAGFEAARVRLWVAQGRSAELENWLQHDRPVDARPLTVRHEARNIAHARALIGLGRMELAGALLRKLRDAVEAGDRTGHRIEILTLLAAAAPADEAAASLESALLLAEPEGYVRCFVELPRLRPLIAELRRQFEHQDRRNLAQYAGALLAAGSVEPAPASTMRRPPGGLLPPMLAEPLTRRELEVLQLVAKGLTNQQIADQLIISLRTVKKHIENLYGKLAVENRVQALARARELGLL